MADTFFLKKLVILCILPATIDFFHLTLLRNNGYQAKLELYLIKTLYYMENKKIQNGRHLFSKKISNFVHFACNNWFFHLTLHRNNGHQAKLQLYLIKNLYYMKNDKNKKWAPSIWKKSVYIDKNGKSILKKYTIIFYFCEIRNVQQSTKFVFFPFIWSISNVFLVNSSKTSCEW